MVAPLAIATGLKAGLELTRDKSVSIAGYDFVGLASRLVFFYAIAFMINLYFQAIIKGGTFLNLIGVNVPDTIPDSLRKLFEEGYNGFTFWNIVQIISIIIVVIEALQYEKELTQNNKKANASTIAVFSLIVLGISLATLPQLINKIKEKRIIDTSGKFNPPNWDKPYDYGSPEHKRHDPSSFPAGGI